MRAITSRVLIFGTVLALTAGSVAAQETSPATGDATAKELTYFDLRGSKDRLTQRFAERYFSLVKTQEWSDLNGKYKTTAKYVDHDPEMKWVLLEIAQGRGAARVASQKKIPVDKLSKVCQSRVRQIATLQVKMEELVAAEKKRGTEGGTDSRGGYGGEGEESGRGGTEGYGEYGATTTEAPASESPAASEYGAAPAAVDDGANDPDPLGFGELAGELAAAPPGGGAFPISPPGTTPPQLGEAASTGPADSSQWKSSYAAFHANLTAGRDSSAGPATDWGSLTELKQMVEKSEANILANQDPYRTEVSEASKAIGEVRWQAPFASLEAADETGMQEIRFTLPALQAPLQLKFVADPNEVSLWEATRPGQPVDFTGTFDVVKPGELLIRVRQAN